MQDGRDSSILHRTLRVSLARLTVNLGLGTAVFGFALLTQPSTTALQAMPTCVVALIAMACGWFLNLRNFPLLLPEIYHGRIFRRFLAVILIGSSLAAFIWSLQQIPEVIFPIVIGFIARWIIYLLELQDIRVCDRRKVGLPPLTARLRLWITVSTGFVIPALVLLQLPGPPLLLLSFLLTSFAQWSATCEIAVTSASSASSE
jgi:hypothetical protein